MIDTVINLLFRCAHRKLTRPVTPVSKAGVANGETYVVCLDCGKQFSYDLNAMRIGKVIDHSNDACVLPPNMPKPRGSKLKYGLLAAVPLAVVLNAAFKGKTPENAKAKPVDEDADGKGGDG